MLLDLDPAPAVAVGDRVRVHASYSPLRTNVRAGMTGTVVDVRAPMMPCLGGGYWTRHPFAVAIDALDGRVYGFCHEDLEAAA